MSIRILEGNATALRDIARIGAYPAYPDEVQIIWARFKASPHEPDP